MFIPVGRLRERECSGETELAQLARPRLPKRKSATLCPRAAAPVRGKTRQATTRRCRQGVCLRGREGTPESRTKLPVLAEQSQRHTRTRAVNRRLHQPKRQSNTPQP